MSHKLFFILELVRELSSLAKRLSNVTGEPTRMRYPDTMSGQIPATAYKRQQAEESTAFAEEIIKIVQREYIK